MIFSTLFRATNEKEFCITETVSISGVVLDPSNSVFFAAVYATVVGDSRPTEDVAPLVSSSVRLAKCEELLRDCKLSV